MQKIKQSTLLSDENAYLADLIEKVRGYLQINDKNGLPKFDLISKIVAQTPFYVFDHPDLVPHFGDTACTDGHHVFFYSEFLKELYDEDRESKLGDPKLLRTQSLLTVAIHEPFHIALLHCNNKRLSNFPHAIANVAEDIKINSIIKHIYKINTGPKTMSGAWGFTDEEFRLFHGQSEETIAKILCAVIKKNKQNNPPQSGQPQSGQPQSGQPQSGQPQSGQPQSGQPQSGQPQSGQPQSGQPQSGQPQNGQPQSGQPQSSQPQSSQPQSGQPQSGQPQSGQPQSGQRTTKNTPSNMGIPSMSQGLIDKICSISLDNTKDIGKAISLKETIDALNNAGLSNIAENALKLPKADDDKKIQEMEDKVKSRVNNALGELANERRIRSTGNSGFGGPCEAYATEVISAKQESKIKISSRILEMVLGEGNQMEASFEMPHPFFNLDPDTFGLENNLYIESLMPAKKKSGAIFFIGDTSGSMGHQDLVDSFSVCYSAIKNADENDGVNNIYFLCADTDVRGEIIELTDENIDDISSNIPIYGRGGTNILTPLKTAMKWAREKEIEVAGFIYATDLDVDPPKKHLLPDNMPPIIFLATNNLRINEFRKACADYADVFDIDSESQIDFDLLAEKNKKNNFKPKF